MTATMTRPTEDAEVAHILAPAHRTSTQPLTRGSLAAWYVAETVAVGGTEEDAYRLLQLISAAGRGMVAHLSQEDIDSLHPGLEIVMPDEQESEPGSWHAAAELHCSEDPAKPTRVVHTFDVEHGKRWCGVALVDVAQMGPPLEHID